jgi:hypothetical protein
VWDGSSHNCSGLQLWECVYALKVSARKDGVDAPIVPVFEEVRVHTFKLQGGRCGGGGVNESCTIDRCDVEFNPACGQ